MPAALLALEVFAGAGIAATANGARPHAAVSKPPDITKLFSSALCRVRSHPAYKHAQLLEADGSTEGNRLTSSASGIVTWIFSFRNVASRSKYAGLTIEYRYGHGFGRVHGQRFPVLEDVQIPHHPHLTLTRAIRLMRAAGFHKKFGSVVLRDPLGPHSSHPLYIFLLSDGRNIAVDTVTDRVAPIS